MADTRLVLRKHHRRDAHVRPVSSLPAGRQRSRLSATGARLPEAAAMRYGKSGKRTSRFRPIKAGRRPVRSSAHHRSTSDFGHSAVNQRRSDVPNAESGCSYTGSRAGAAGSKRRNDGSIAARRPSTSAVPLLPPQDAQTWQVVASVGRTTVGCEVCKQSVPLAAATASNSASERPASPGAGGKTR